MTSKDSPSLGGHWDSPIFASFSSVSTWGDLPLNKYQSDQIESTASGYVICWNYSAKQENTLHCKESIFCAEKTFTWRSMHQIMGHIDYLPLIPWIVASWALKYRHMASPPKPQENGCVTFRAAAMATQASAAFPPCFRISKTKNM